MSNTSDSLEIYQSYGSKVTSVSMEERFVVVGLEDGSVECTYTQGGNKPPTRKWNLSVSQVPITAVLAYTFDVKEYDFDNQIEPNKRVVYAVFYAGDQAGQLFAINQRGKLISSIKICDSPIFAILDKNIREIIVYTEGCRFLVSLIKKQLMRKKVKTSKFSMEHDGSFYTARQAGEIPLEEYNCSVPAGMEGTTRLLVYWDEEKTFLYSHSYSTMSHLLSELIEKDEAPEFLEIVDKDHNVIRTLEFDSPVRQVLNLFHENTVSRKDAVYVLLWNDTIVRFRATELVDEDIDDEDLNTTTVYSVENSDPVDADAGTKNDGDIRVMTAKLGKVCFINETEQSVLYVVNDEELVEKKQGKKQRKKAKQSPEAVQEDAGRKPATAPDQKTQDAEPKVINKQPETVRVEPHKIVPRNEDGMLDQRKDDITQDNERKEDDINLNIIKDDIPSKNGSKTEKESRKKSPFAMFKKK